MSVRHYLTCLWPGMPELWWRGQLSALPAAMGFAACLNLLLITRFLYPEWLSGMLVRLACWVGVAVWLFLVIRSVRELPQLLNPREVSDEPDRFPDATKAYLAGNWAETEGLLTDVLAIEPRDPPALLMLAAVYRHTGRFVAARELLDQISRCEAADSWWLEREAEQQRLERELAVEDNEEGEQDEPADQTDSSAELTADELTADAA